MILFGQGRLAFPEPNKRLERFAMHWSRSFSIIFSCNRLHRKIYHKDCQCEFITICLRYAIICSRLQHWFSTNEKKRLTICGGSYLKRILKARYIYIFRTKIYLVCFLYSIEMLSNRDLILRNNVCPNSRISLLFPVSMDEIKQSGNMEPLISMNPFDSFEEAFASSECAGSRLYSMVIR